MIRKNQALKNLISALLDLALVFAAFAAASWLWLVALNGDSGNMAMLSGRMAMLALIYAMAQVFVLSLLGFYSPARGRSLSWRLGMILAATTMTVLAASFLLYLFRLVDFSRGVLLLFYLFTLALLGAKYVVSERVEQALRISGRTVRHEVLIGTGPLSAQYAQDVKNAPELGIQLDAVVSPEDAKALGSALASQEIDEAVIALEPHEYMRIREMIGLCEKNGVKYLVIPFYNDIIPAHPVIESVGRSKLINMRANRLENVGWAVLKRGFDLVASALGLIVISPLLLALAIGVKLSSPGPILFRQVRVGYKRKLFKMLKFRSMRVNDQAETAWSTPADSRRTAFGSLIRKMSLDELPQLWNVLKGDMSLVGPRPELPHFVEQFKETVPYYMVKHQVKPGITGWAQVNGYRGDTSIEKRIEMDLWYIDNWSPALDVKILFRTFFGGMLNDERVGTACGADIKVIVAAHKPYWMPADPMYLPVQVGAQGRDSLGFAADNTGENISAKNANYCELTGLYWAWKNVPCDYLGLAHYRRHFTLRRIGKSRRHVLTGEQAARCLTEADVILPRPRNYLIETNYSQYAHAHHAVDLDTARAILAERHPEYLEAFDRCMKRTWGHRFNMFIMRRDVLNRYCQWLFDVLFELEKRLDIAAYSDNDRRVFGFVSERLLDVWLETNGVRYKEIPYVFLERQNWLVKGGRFVMRKLAGERKAP